MITLIIDDHIPLIKGVLEPFAKIVYAKGGLIDREMAMKADGLIIRTRTVCNAAFLKGTPVKFIATATIGFDHIDTEYCEKEGVTWHFAPGCNSSSVMQYIASSLVTLARLHHIRLEGRIIGIIGAGHVGQKVAYLANCLGMKSLLNDPPRERNENNGGFCSLTEIRNKADIITFHVPLTRGGIDNTFHLADQFFFRDLQNKPLIINTSRGEVVKTASVKSAVRSGLISGYAADVWENEPEPDPELVEISDLATPHIAGYSIEGKANGTVACVQAASRFFGFGLDDWYPVELPSPEQPVIEIDAKGKSVEEVLSEAILKTYDVAKDDRLLRNDLSCFENIRNYYGIRHEFQAYNLKIANASPETLDISRKLGFNATTGEYPNV